MFVQELRFVPAYVRDQLRSLCLDGEESDASWDLWS